MYTNITHPIEKLLLTERVN